MCTGLGFKVSVVNLNYGNITGHELAVFLSTADVELWVYDDLLYWQDDIILLFSVGGGVPVTTDNFRICPRDLNNRSIGATVLTLSAETGADVWTAAVGHQLALLRLTDEGTVGTRDQDCRTWGSGQQGDPTHM